MSCWLACVAGAWKQKSAQVRTGPNSPGVPPGSELITRMNNIAALARAWTITSRDTVREQVVSLKGFKKVILQVKNLLR